jgi:NADH dehydrogenase FAD-containing subunit
MTKQTILVAGSGFAGVWAVLAAARAIALAGREDHIDLVMVAPQPRLAIRPRFYEAVLDNMDPDVSELLKVVGARFVDGIVETIGADTRQAAILRGDGSRETIGWDRFVLATGSRVAMPPIPVWSNTPSPLTSSIRRSTSTRISRHCPPGPKAPRAIPSWSRWRLYRTGSGHRTA